MKASQNREVIHTVNSSAVWDEPDGIKFIHEILERGIDNVEQSRQDQPFHDPKAVPIVLFPETSTLWKTQRLYVNALRDSYRVPQMCGSMELKCSRRNPVHL